MYNPVISREKIKNGGINMADTFTGNQLKAIPIESLVAVVDAQKQLSASMYSFIKEVALDENGNVKNVNFNYSAVENGEKVEKLFLHHLLQ